MKIGKLDKRFKGHQFFEYYCDYNKLRNPSMEEFIECRSWAWQSFGPSSEIDTLLMLNQSKPWAWDISEWRCRILLRSEVEYSWFVMKFDYATKNKSR